MKFKGLSPLFITVTIRSFASSILGIFTPLYLFGLFETHPFFTSGQAALFGVLVYFIIYHLSVLIFNYLAISLVRHIHFRGSMMLGNFFVAAGFLFLILAKENLWFLVPSALFGGLAVPCYWNPFHAIFIEDGRQKRLGRDLTTREVLDWLPGIVGPTLGGIIITYFGFRAVYTLALILVCLSSLPIFFTPHHKKFDLSPFKSLVKEFFSRNFCKDFISLSAVGVEAKIMGVFWPIFVFAIIGSYEVMGFLSSAVAVVSLITLLLVGNLLDKRSKSSFLIFGGIVTSLIWLLRVFVKTTAQVFFIDSTDTVLAKFWILPLEALVFKKAEDGTLINYLILREWAIHGGHLLALFFMIFLLVFGFSYVISFVLAAGAILLSLLIAT